MCTKKFVSKWLLTERALEYFISTVAAYMCCKLRGVSKCFLIHVISQSIFLRVSTVMVLIHCGCVYVYLNHQIFLNNFLQKEHWKVLSTSWFCLCEVKLVKWFNGFWHREHGNIFTVFVSCQITRCSKCLSTEGELDWFFSTVTTFVCS